MYSWALGPFVLDIIGHTGGATKYGLFASLAIYVMALVDGHVATAYSRTAMLWIDGLAGVAGACMLMFVVWILRQRRLDPAPMP